MAQIKKNMIEDPESLIQSLVASLYLAAITIAGYVGWGAIKIFKFLAPRSAKIVGKVFKDWINKELQSKINHLEEQVSEMKNSINKIEKATHGKSAEEKGVLLRLLEVADKLEHKLEQNDK